MQPNSYFVKILNLTPYDLTTGSVLDNMSNNLSYAELLLTVSRRLKHTLCSVVRDVGGLRRAPQTRGETSAGRRRSSAGDRRIHG